MVKLFGKELGKGQLAGRILLGLLVSGFIIFAFYIIPYHFDLVLIPLLSAFGLPQENLQQGSAFIMNTLILPNIPYLLGAVAIALAVAVFAETLLRETDVHGPVMIAANVLWVALVAVIFEGGNLDVVVPLGMPLGQIVVSSVVVRAGIFLLMLLCMLPYALSAVKGAMITLRTREQKRAPKPP